MEQSEEMGEEREERKKVKLPKGHKLRCKCAVCKIIKDKIPAAQYKNMSNADVNKLAKDILNSAVFTDRHIHPNDISRMMTMIFPVFSFMGTEDTISYDKNPPGMVYEYYGEEMPRGVNGYPMFLSAHMCSKDATKRVWEKVTAMEEALKAVMGDEEDDGEPGNGDQEVQDMDATGRKLDNLEISGESGRRVHTGDAEDTQYPDSPDAERGAVPVGDSGHEQQED